MLFPLITSETETLPFFITGVGTKVNQNPIKRNEGYPSYQLSWCLKGSGKFIISGNEYEIHENMGFFFSPDIPHEYYAAIEPWTIKWVAFKGCQVQNILKLIGAGSYEVFCMPEFKEISILMEEIYRAAENNNALESSALLYSLLVKWGKWLNASTTHSIKKKHTRLEPVLLFMEENYGEDISLEKLSNIIHVSPDFLCRLFKQSYATSPFKYLINLRIQKAKHLLIALPHLLIKDVAKSVGFNDVSYFCSVFKEYEGTSPNAFRALHGT